VNEPVMAYAWFRRLARKSPGHWEPCTARQGLSIMRHLRYNGMYEVPIGEVISAGTMGTWYEYICVSTPVPPENYAGLEEV
jgi:hypothetical protein